MKFRFITEKINQNGSTESSVAEFGGEELLIGRGGNSQLILTGRTVSLVHAKLIRQGDKLIVEDAGSLTGIRVNSRRTQRTEIAEGDSLQIGEVKLQVGSVTADEVTLTRKAESGQQGSSEDQVDKQLAALSLRTYLPSMRVISLSAALILAVFYFLLPMTGSNIESWSSGPISNSHKMIEGDCQSCHSTSFVQVEDKDCVKCHSMTEHADGLAKLVAHRPEHNLRCAQCHMEHNGDDVLAETDPRVCSGCHQNLKEIKSDTAHLNVESFDQHPQFRVDVRVGDEKVERVSLDDTARIKDSSHLKLNHALHLKAGLRGKDGPVTLQCSACHQLEADFRSMKPINFENHCKDCHTLGFDDRLPSVQAPHGDDEAVYPALFTEYTKLLLMRNGETASSPPSSEEFQRSLPGGASSVSKPARGEAGDVSSVVSQARMAEKELFTKTACYVCHDTSEKPAVERTSTNAHFQVQKPRVPATWLKKAIFSHGSHEEVSCESCHEGTRKSSKTSDVLLPGVKSCQDCHVQGVKQGFVKSDCTMCHSYHDPLGFPYEKKKSIADYLSLIKR